MTLFPYSNFATLILAYFAYAALPPTADPEESPPPTTIEYEDSFYVIQVSGPGLQYSNSLNPTGQDLYNDLPDSVFASRIVVNIHHTDCDYESIINAAETGLDRTRKLESGRGKSFPKLVC